VSNIEPVEFVNIHIQRIPLLDFAYKRLGCRMHQEHQMYFPQKVGPELGENKAEAAEPLTKCLRDGLVRSSLRRVESRFRGDYDTLWSYSRCILLA